MPSQRPKPEPKPEPRVIEEVAAVGTVDLDELERLFRETPVDLASAAKSAKEIAPDLDTDSVDRNVAGVPARHAAQIKNPHYHPAKQPLLQAMMVMLAHAQVGRDNPIRVNVETLEQLMTMVSELVLTRNQLLDLMRRQEEVNSRYHCSVCHKLRQSCRKPS